jgi:hypothetical protein
MQSKSPDPFGKEDYQKLTNAGFRRAYRSPISPTAKTAAAAKKTPNSATCEHTEKIRIRINDLQGRPPDPDKTSICEGIVINHRLSRGGRFLLLTNHWRIRQKPWSDGCFSG